MREYSSEIAFRDVLFNMILAFMVMIFLLLVIIGEKNTESNEATDNPVSDLRVEIYWPDGMDVDVDLWAKGPDGSIVGYNSPHSPILDLVRDDLGGLRDATERNYEIMFGRGIPPGEYSFTVHWYSNRDGVETVPVEVMVYEKLPNSSASVLVYHGKVVLRNLYQEEVLIRFTVREKNGIDVGTLNRLPIKIRTSSKGG